MNSHLLGSIPAADQQWICLKMMHGYWAEEGHIVSTPWTASSQKCDSICWLSHSSTRIC